MTANRKRYWMKRKPTSDFGDLVVEADFEEIKEGAQRIIGPRMKIIEEEGGELIFSDDTETCPLQVKAIPLGEGFYRLDVASKCTVKDCDYFGECTRLDARAAKALGRAMAEILDAPERVYDARKWTPERIRDDERLQRIIDRLIDEGT